MILDARPIVAKKVELLKDRVSKLDVKPKLVILRVGDDLASEKYVNNKVKKCEEVGIVSEVIHFEESVQEVDVVSKILDLNIDKEVTGILLQLPLPKHLDEHYLTNLISSEKDVDGFTENNMGKLVLGKEGNVACTPTGIIELLKAYDIPLASKDVLIVNRSNIVGKPLAHLFLQEDATVTVAHSKTKDLKEKVAKADIVVLGVGRADFVGDPHFKDGAVIVDVSINFDGNGKMCGDVRKSDYEALVHRGCHITPVPFGVGQMTVLSLIEQTVEIAERNR